MAVSEINPLLDYIVVAFDTTPPTYAWHHASISPNDTDTLFKIFSDKTVSHICIANPRDGMVCRVRRIENKPESIWMEVFPIQSATAIHNKDVNVYGHIDLGYAEIPGYNATSVKYMTAKLSWPTSFTNRFPNLTHAHVHCMYVHIETDMTERIVPALPHSNRKLLSLSIGTSLTHLTLSIDDNVRVIIDDLESSSLKCLVCRRDMLIDIDRVPSTICALAYKMTVTDITAMTADEQRYADFPFNATKYTELRYLEQVIHDVASNTDYVLCQFKPAREKSTYEISFSNQIRSDGRIIRQQIQLIKYDDMQSIITNKTFKSIEKLKSSSTYRYLVTMFENLPDVDLHCLSISLRSNDNPYVLEDNSDKSIWKFRATMDVHHSKLKHD